MDKPQCMPWYSAFRPIYLQLLQHGDATLLLLTLSLWTTHQHNTILPIEWVRWWLCGGETSVKKCKKFHIHKFILPSSCTGVGLFSVSILVWRTSWLSLFFIQTSLFTSHILTYLLTTIAHSNSLEVRGHSCCFRFDLSDVFKRSTRLVWCWIQSCPHLRNIGQYSNWIKHDLSDLLELCGGTKDYTSGRWGHARAGRNSRGFDFSTLHFGNIMWILRDIFWIRVSIDVLYCHRGQWDINLPNARGLVHWRGWIIWVRRWWRDEGSRGSTNWKLRRRRCSIRVFGPLFHNFSQNTNPWIQWTTTISQDYCQSRWVSGGWGDNHAVSGRPYWRGILELISADIKGGNTKNSIDFNREYY